jgi:hypothetical protein
MRRRKEISDEEIKKNFRVFLEQMGEAAGISPEEMGRLWKEFIESSRTNIGWRVKGRRPLHEKRFSAVKVTVYLKSNEAHMFNALKGKFRSKTNSEALRTIIREAYKLLTTNKV